MIADLVPSSFTWMMLHNLYPTQHSSTVLQHWTVGAIIPPVKNLTHAFVLFILYITHQKGTRPSLH